MKRFLLAFAVSIFNLQPALAGDVVASKVNAIDYFNSNGWVALVIATSTAEWPNWLGYQGGVAFDDVVRSGLMLYRCNPSIPDGCTLADFDTHRFVFSGPTTPAYPFAGAKVTVNDKFSGGLFKRTWAFSHIEGAIQTVGHFPFSEFASTAPGPVFPLDHKVVFHLADVDTIDAMLSGNFGPPLAHRSTLPCIPLRVVNGVLFSTQCKTPE